MSRNGNKQQQIMKAAERLFTSRRFHEITTDDIAAAAKVGKGTIYRYFKDKDDLFCQVASGGFDEMCALLEQQIKTGESFEQQLELAWKVIGDFYIRRRQLFRMMQTEESRMPWVRGTPRQNWCEKRKRLVTAVAEVIGRGVREGKLRDDISAPVLAGLLMGMLRMQARELSDEEPVNVGLLMDFYRRGSAPLPVKVEV